MSKQITINEKTFNTYATVDDAENYFIAKFGFEWATIGDTQKPQLLITATRFIDTKDYSGMPVDANQALKFPRLIEKRILKDGINHYSNRFINGEDISDYSGPMPCTIENHPYYGREVITTSDDLLMVACCELAEMIYKNNGIGANIANISSVSMGDSSISFRNNTQNESEIEQTLYQYLKDYMRGNIGIIK